jgi:hypothetical protein
MEIVEEINSGETDTTIRLGESLVYRTLLSGNAVSLAQHFNKLDPDTSNKFIETQFVEPKKSAMTQTIMHRKVAFISYPHEWCAAMLKDAALFELELLQELYQQGYFLKDLHPWNVLFENGQYKHIDLPSLVELKALPQEINLKHTNGDQTHDAVNAILKDMLIPYFIYPLLGMAFGKRNWIRERIFNTTLNAASSTMNMRDLMPPKAWRWRTVRNIWRLCFAKYQLWGYLKDPKQSIEHKIKSMIKYIKGIPVSSGTSDYCHYYAAKGEAQTDYSTSALNPKQQNVRLAIDNPDIKTVCDVACNTGWYAKMAANLGKSVIAFDIDEACIEDLYLQVKNQKLSIVSVVASFMELTPSRYSHDTGKRVLMAAQMRFRSDCVLALGIFHHLILGENCNIDRVIDHLANLAKKCLVLEFIDLKDDKIANHADFFPAYHRNPSDFTDYQQTYIIQKLEKYFSSVSVQSSSEPTRSLLICRKMSEV